MWIEDAAARVVSTLGRGQSLFSHTGAELPAPAAALADAAVARAAFGGDEHDQSGAGARAAVTEVLAGREQVARTHSADVGVHREISTALRTVTEGAQSAHGHKSRAADVPAEFGPWADLPAATPAAMRVLRSRLVGMQALVQTSAVTAQRSAARLRATSYDAPEQG